MQPNPILHSNPIAFGEALREVQIVKVSLSELERKWRLREQDAYARGVADGERALSEQLVQQRADLRHLQNRLFVQFENAIPQVVRDCEQALIAIAWETQADGDVAAGIPAGVAAIAGLPNRATATSGEVPRAAASPRRRAAISDPFSREHQ